ncbi:MAG: hypothetical protein WA510_24445 [Acidobacteriaceae bacterium]
MSSTGNLTTTRPGPPFLGRLRELARPRILLTVYFLACIGFFLVRTAHWKQVNDPAQLHYLCFLMDHGMAPYRDILEVNMPGIYLVNWSVMHSLGGGSAAWRAFDIGLVVIAAWAMVVIARPYDWLAGVFAATLFILFHGKDGAGQEGQRDLIISVLLLCAYAFLFRSFRKRGAWPMLAFGLCAGIASTIKPMPLPFALLLLLLAAWRWKRMGEPLLKPCLFALLGLALPFAIVVAFLDAKHALGAFWYLLHVELPFYQSVGRLSTGKVVALMLSGSLKTITLIALAIALLKRDWGTWEEKLLLVGVAFGAACYLAQGKAFPYHRYPLLAFLFLWAGLEIVLGLRAQGKVRWLAISGVAFAVVLAPIYANLGIHKVWDPRFSDSLARDLTRLGGSQLSGHVQCLDTPADCDATLYDLRLVQSTGLFYDFLVFGSGQVQVIHDLRERFWQQFQQNPPQVIVVGTGLFPLKDGYHKLETWPQFRQELSNNYFLYDDRSFPPAESGLKGYRIYVAKNRMVAPDHNSPGL